MNPSLIHTERKLIALLLASAFLFLIIFEGFFLISRFIFEENISKEGFNAEMKRIENRDPNSEKRGRMNGPRLGMSMVTFDKSGTIIHDPGHDDTMMDEEMISFEFLNDLETGVVTKKDDVLIYKRLRPENPDFYQVFIRKSGYPLEDLLRDILRFFILDLVIIAPFYFMGRYFVRKTLEPVGENIETMSHFIHDAGHELKTPLAIVSGNLQIMRESKKNEHELIEESIQTIHAMSDTLDALLELSNVKKGGKIEKISLYDAVLFETGKEKHQIESKKIQIHLDIPKNTLLQIDGKHFSLLFGNILRNAINYNKIGGEIRISYKENILAISDTGKGIDGKNLGKIWDRFYRVDKNSDTHGSGIGLSIVSKIAELYNWKINVTSKKDIGSTFSFTIK